jgi:hypothetical protein
MKEKTKLDYKKIGKRNKLMGADFERRTRAYMESLGYCVTKWHNNVKENKVISAKPGFYRQMQTGFPDFLCFIHVDNMENPKIRLYDIIMIECKINGRLSKEEKEKVKFYLDHDYCDKFYIASKGYDGRKIKIILTEIERG